MVGDPPGLACPSAQSRVSVRLEVDSTISGQNAPILSKTRITMALDPAQRRRDFPILQQTVHRQRPLIYFDNAASTQHPVAVLDAMEQCYRHDYANVHRGIHTLSERMTEHYEQARQKVQHFLGAAAVEEILFTSGTTAGINLVAHSYGSMLQEGDELIVTQMEHHSNIVPWQQLAQRNGLTIRWWEVDDHGQLNLNDLDQLIGPRTKLLAVAAASNVLGTINPIGEIVKRAHQNNVKVLVDAAQSVPHSLTRVTEWDCDFLAFSAHKMLGPSGIGILYGKKDLLESMPPFLGGGSMIHTVEQSGFTPAPLPARFEAGTPPIAETTGLAAAIDYLQEVGLQEIFQHEQKLVAQCLEQIETLPGIKILGPAANQRVGLVSFTVEGVNSQDLARFLDFRGIAVRAGHHCAMPLHQRFDIPNSVRASFYLYNTEDEVSRFCEELPGVIEKLR